MTNNTDPVGMEAAYKLGVALYAMAQRFVVFHVRAGQHRNDRRIGALMHAAPVSRSMCGEKVTGRDLNEVSARQMIRDGLVRETGAEPGQPGAFCQTNLITMCPTCRGMLGEDAHMRARAGLAPATAPRNLSKLSERRGSATGKQISFLRTLLDQAFGALYQHGTGLDRHHLENVSMREASAAIDTLVGAKKRGWK